MPRIDRGSLIAEVSKILRLPREEMLRLLREAAEKRAILVTQPSIVPVYTPSGVLRVAVGPGSLIFPPGERPSVEIPLLEAAAPEWVDGCRMAPGSGRRARTIEGEGDERCGRAVPGDLRDPLSLFVTGAEGCARRPPRRVPPIAVIQGVEAAWYEREGPVTSVTRGEALERLEYMSIALSYCEGEG